MLAQIIFERLRQGHNTMKYPAVPPASLPELFAGRPELAAGKCADCAAPCVEACPTGALTVNAGVPALDTGKCLFCRRCEKTCPQAVITFTRDHQLAATSREDLIVTPGAAKPAVKHALAQKEFKHSLALRVVSAGGCGSCEADTNVLTTLAWDISRFGIKYVASPRHADGVLVTGPVTPNMRRALLDTYAATPAPKVVIALGTCPISGGLFASAPAMPPACDPAASPATPASVDASVSAVAENSGVTPHLPVDLFIPGCPPHPFTILDAFLRFIGVVEN